MRAAEREYNLLSICLFKNSVIKLFHCVYQFRLQLFSRIRRLLVALNKSRLTLDNASAIFDWRMQVVTLRFQFVTIKTHVAMRCASGACV